MKVGDEVSWMSSGTEKFGKIILEVAPGETQEVAKERLLEATGYDYNVNPLSGGPPRPEVSYFVAVYDGGPKAKVKVYHPKVSALKLDK